MTGRRRAWMSWSSGKDSAFALQAARATPDLDVVALLTTVTEAYARVSMHGVRKELLRAQALSVGLPLVEVRIPSPCPDAIYEARMGEALALATDDGVDTVVFGDLFLADIRAYREEKLSAIGLRAEFPLWHRDTGELARDMIASGLRAVLTCVDPRKVPAAFAGRAFDAALLAELPAGVDPCGENGEFHTFVHAGPPLREAIAVRAGEVVERDGFVFADVVPWLAALAVAVLGVGCSTAPAQPDTSVNPCQQLSGECAYCTQAAPKQSCLTAVATNDDVQCTVALDDPGVQAACVPPDGGADASLDAGDAAPLPACNDVPLSPDAGCACSVECTPSCPTGGCDVTCLGGTMCSPTCAGGGCTFHCQSGATCEASCAGGNCIFNCAAGSTCANSCTGGGCTFQCEDGAICNDTCGAATTCIGP
ncbi:MAG TPA: hypothetical protein VIF15_09130 [Polyangiaceae bacterium]|jgi:uncharacterized protein (TIGR00290 family)